MLTPSRMLLFSILVPREELEPLVGALLGIGAFHPVEARAAESGLDGLAPLDVEKEYAAWRALGDEAASLASRLGLGPAPAAARDIGLDDARADLSALAERVSALSKRREELLNELRSSEALAARLASYLPLPAGGRGAHSFLEVVAARTDPRNIAVIERSLGPIPHVLYPFRDAAPATAFLLIGLRRDRETIAGVLRDLAIERADAAPDGAPAPEEVRARIDADMDRQRRAVEAADREIAALARESAPSIASLAVSVGMKRVLLETKRLSAGTASTAVLAGWVPAEDRDRALAVISRAAPRAYVEQREPALTNVPVEDVPVRLRHGSLLKPFELLVEAYGIPRYGTVDPTVFVAVSFLAMFGAMFADLGHGLALAAGGLLLRRSGRPAASRAGGLLAYSGLSAAVFGALFGSFLGFEFESVWPKPMHDILRIFRISVFFGVGLISLGILLNILNALRDRDYRRALFDKAGLIAAVVYWAGIAMAARYLADRTAVPTACAAVVAAGCLALFLKPLFVRGGGHGESGFVAYMESFVDILEIVMGYLANTISFIRVAAFSLAHAGLFIAIFRLSDLLKPTAHGVFSILVLVAGNILVVLLEGMVVGIQSLRLNYYEFFSRFFVPGHREYRPLTL